MCFPFSFSKCINLESYSKCSCSTFTWAWKLQYKFHCKMVSYLKIYIQNLLKLIQRLLLLQKKKNLKKKKGGGWLLEKTFILEKVTLIIKTMYSCS